MLSITKPKRFMVLAGCIFFLCLGTTIMLISPAYAWTDDEDAVIVSNGNILTMNASQPTASAMALKAGKIIAVGDFEAVKKAK